MLNITPEYLTYKLREQSNKILSYSLKNREIKTVGNISPQDLNKLYAILDDAINNPSKYKSNQVSLIKELNEDIDFQTWLNNLPTEIKIMLRVALKPQQSIDWYKSSFNEIYVALNEDYRPNKKYRDRWNRLFTKHNIVYSL